MNLIYYRFIDRFWEDVCFQPFPKSVNGSKIDRRG